MAKKKKKDRVTESHIEDPALPDGTVLSKMIYLNDKNIPTVKSKATRFELLQFNAAGDNIKRTYGTL